MKKNILFVLLTVLLSSCFELDNYDAPNAGINGSLIDSETVKSCIRNNLMVAVSNCLIWDIKTRLLSISGRRQMVHSVMLPYLRVITRYRRSKVLFPGYRRRT